MEELSGHVVLHSILTPCKQWEFGVLQPAGNKNYCELFAIFLADFRYLTYVLNRVEYELTYFLINIKAQTRLRIIFSGISLFVDQQVNGI